MTIKTIGLDLAKNVFQVHGIDDTGAVVLRRTLRRAQVAHFFAHLPPCVIGMESCSTSQYWARKLAGLGHQTRLIPAQFVKPYVRSNKNDANDAAAICEAIGRPEMRFVPLKTPEQQSILAVHRVREGFVKARTACAKSNSGNHRRVWPRASAGVRSRIEKRCTAGKPSGRPCARDGSRTRAQITRAPAISSAANR